MIVRAGLDEHVVAVADVGDALQQVFVLRGGEGCDDDDQCGYAQLEDDVFTAAVCAVRAHLAPPIFEVCAVS